MVFLVIFVIGKPLYKIKEPEGNIVVEVLSCIGHALKEKFKAPKDQKLAHWLDYSEYKYGRSLVNDVRTTLKVMVLFVPLPIFWALYDQQGSGYVLFLLNVIEKPSAIPGTTSQKILFLL